MRNLDFQAGQFAVLSLIKKAACKRRLSQVQENNMQGALKKNYDGIIIGAGHRYGRANPCLAATFALTP